MSHVVSLTPEQLKQQAKVYIEACEMVRAANQKVKNTNNEMATQWKGKAFEKYLVQYEQLNKSIVAFENLLIDINNQCCKYADIVAQRDIDDQRAFGLQ